MSRSNIWNENTKKTGFMRPMRSVGQVLTNGKINHSLVVMGTHNTRPYWPMPSGQYIEMMRKARRADIVWAYLPKASTSNLMDKGTSGLWTMGSNIDHDVVSGLVSINGQGDADQDNHQFMSLIQPLGIALMDNEKNETDRFNLHFGGIDTVINNGNKRINAGDWVCAYAPTYEEVKELQGGRGDDCDRNGVATLWYMPYRPEDHKFTCSNINKCLLRRDKNDYTNQTRDFELVSKVLIKSILKSSLVTLQSMVSTGNESTLTQMINASNGNDKPQLDNLIEGLMSDSDFMTKLVNDLTTHDNVTQNPAISAPVEDMLVAYAYFIKDKTKDILGKAVTSANPKENFELHQRSYAK